MRALDVTTEHACAFQQHNLCCTFQPQAWPSWSIALTPLGPLCMKPHIGTSPPITVWPLEGSSPHTWKGSTIQLSQAPPSQNATHTCLTYSNLKPYDQWRNYRTPAHGNLLAITSRGMAHPAPSTPKPAVRSMLKIIKWWYHSYMFVSHACWAGMFSLGLVYH